MLQAARLLARQRPGGHEGGRILLLHLTAASFQTEATMSRWGKTSMLEELWTIKRPKRKKNQQPTTQISAEDNQVL